MTRVKSCRMVLGCVASMLVACKDSPAPEGTLDVATMRLSIAAPTSETVLDVGAAPGCAVVAGGMQLPVSADVTISATFLSPDGEAETSADVLSRYRLSGDGGDEPVTTAPNVSVTRLDAFTLRFSGAAASTGSATLSLVHSQSGATVWGPCAVPVTVLAPETAAESWTTPAGSPESAGSHFQDGSFLTPLQGWVIGAPGVVHHTVDGGNSWEKRFDTPSNSSVSFFRSVAFVNESKGWIGDLNRFNNPEPLRSLWETVDGGRTWANISQRVAGAPVAGICGLWVVNPSTVAGVGRWNGPAVFVKTQDGGATWQSTSLSPLMTGAVDVYFFDAQRGLIAGARGVGNSIAEQVASRVVLLATSDGGSTWTERFVGSRAGAWSWKISFPTATVGYIATQGPTSGPVVLKTFDGGATWREIAIVGGPASGFWGAGFSSALVGWVGGDNAVWETRDGGLTWSKAPWAAGQSINRFRMLPDGSAFAIGRQVHRLVPGAPADAH